jgi:C1A family cysteine protease
MNFEQSNPSKNQGAAGSCWTFATDGSFESYLMPGENWSFSENNI